jgi:hypothetical protein
MQSNKPKLIESVFVNKIRQQLHVPKMQSQSSTWYNQVGGFVSNNLLLIIVGLIFVAFLCHRYFYPSKDPLDKILDELEIEEEHESNDDVNKLVRDIRLPNPQVTFNRGYSSSSYYNSHPIQYSNNPLPIPLAEGVDNTQLSLNTGAYMDPYSFSISGALPAVPYSTSYGQFVPNVGFNINPENQLPHSNYLNYGQTYMR